MSEPIVVDHPLIQHKLTLMRDKDCPVADFRRLMKEVSMLLTFEVTRDLPLGTRTIETPLESMEAPVVGVKDPVLVPILRAGTAFLDGMLEVMPEAVVGHVGFYRDPKTLEAVDYYFKMPSDLPERDVILLDPMLATGNTAVAATERLLREKPRSLRFVCLLAAPEGLKQLADKYPGIPVYTAAVDRQLNEKGYIMPGLGDAGDRMYGTF